MTSWADEVEADMDSGVMKVDKISLDLQLLLQVGLELLVNVPENGLDAV
jgi:hypothetical protein